MKFYLKLYVCCSYTCLYSQTHTHTHILPHTHIHTRAPTFTHTKLAMVRETSDKAKGCYMYVTVQFEILDRLEL